MKSMQDVIRYRQVCRRCGKHYNKSIDINFICTQCKAYRDIKRNSILFCLYVALGFSLGCSIYYFTNSTNSVNESFTNESENTLYLDKG